MTITDMPNLCSLIMIDETVFAVLDKTSRPTTFELAVGNATVPFEACAEEPEYRGYVGQDLSLSTKNLHKRSYSLPAETVPGEIYACWVNHLSDWALPGSQTVQLMISKYDSPCHINFDNSIEVPVVEKDMYFEACIAVHRAEGNLHLTLTNTETGAQEKVSVPFDGAFQGGATREGYMPVRVPIPINFSRCTVGLSVEFLSHLPDSKGNEPFFFMADLRVTAPKSRAAAKAILEPLVIYRAPADTDGQWYRAPLPAVLGAGESLSVRIGKSIYPVLDTQKIEFSLRENYGHTLVAESGQELDMILFVDGEAVHRLRIGQHDNIIRLPNKYLNGAVRHVSLKDKSGSITYFESQHLTPALLTPAEVMQRETPNPYPTSLFPQTPLRFAALKAVLAHADAKTDLAQVSHAISVLEGGYEQVKLKPLRFPDVAKPEVSIVMPAHDKVEVTYLALCSLLVAYNDASFEVIVVDDASSDETAQLESIVSGITVLHNDEPQRFIRACNAGAEQAKGDYIVLLNNDVEVTTGWLDELIAAFSRFDNVGLAGSKLLYPNGELQDAGGIVWGNGNPWNYGNRQNPNDPRFCYARQADYLSGAAMMAPAKIWRELGGLSSYMEPMYFEDTDFAFKVREAGYSTWFVPSSIVYHYEGMTAGTDVSTGFKKYQEVNRPKFKRRWARDYATFGKEGHLPDLEKDRGIVGRILFVDYTTPRADTDAGSYAAIHEIRLVQSLGYKVTFLPTNMAHMGSYTEKLQKMGVEVIHSPFFMNVTDYLNKHAQDFDAFYITRYYVGQAVLQQIRMKAPDARVLFNNADLHFLREIRAAQSDGSAEKLEQARRTRTEELEIIRNVDVVLSYNDVEHSVIQAYTDGEAKVVKCPWVVAVPDTIPDLTDRAGMSFLGSFKHHPNAEGITWFVNNVMPLIAAQKEPQSLTIYGSGMNDSIRALKTDLVHPHGFVQDTADAYDSHRIFVAPLLSGAGIKGKVLSALAHGVPCVLSPMAAEGIGLRSGHDCFIVDKPSDWVEAIDKLVSDDTLWTQMSENARSYMRDAFSFEKGREHMRTALEAADMFGSRN